MSHRVGLVSPISLVVGWGICWATHCVGVFNITATSIWLIAVRFIYTYVKYSLHLNVNKNFEMKCSIYIYEITY